MDYKKARKTTLPGCLAVLAVATVRAADCDPGVAGRAEAAYGAGLAQYQAGQVAAAYDQLQFAYDQCPSRPRYRNDYLVAAITAGHAEDALETAADLDTASLPPYVLEALGRGARDLHRAELSLHYYAAIPGGDDNPAVRAGRDLVLLDQGRVADAQADLRALQSRFPAHSAVLEALGLADEAAGDWVPALAAAAAILQREPQHAGALALRYRVLVHLGAPHLAEALTPAAATTAAQRAATRQDELAFEFRWARDEPRPDRVRAAHLDEVIARMRAAIADPAVDADARHTGPGGRHDPAACHRSRGRCLADAAPSAARNRAVPLTARRHPGAVQPRVDALLCAAGKWASAGGAGVGASAGTAGTAVPGRGHAEPAHR
jgi:tetratricopeptide (TPR) repeat protein